MFVFLCSSIAGEYLQTMDDAVESGETYPSELTSKI
jgi:hypothetical protein